jgi:hypothetical protein
VFQLGKPQTVSGILAKWESLRDLRGFRGWLARLIAVRGGAPRCTSLAGRRLTNPYYAQGNFHF